MSYTIFDTRKSRLLAVLHPSTRKHNFKLKRGYCNFQYVSGSPFRHLVRFCFIYLSKQPTLCTTTSPPDTKRTEPKRPLPVFYIATSVFTAVRCVVVSTCRGSQLLEREPLLLAQVRRRIPGWPRNPFPCTT